MNLRTWTGGDAVSDRRALGVGLRHGTRRLAPRLALAMYSGLAFYCLLSILVGPAGLTAYRSLEERKTAMQANLLNLCSLRESLNAELESLRSDPDRAAREARGLGYLRKGETAVVLGERVENILSFETGKVLPLSELAGINDSSLKAIAMGMSLAVLALFYAPRKGRDRSRERRTAAGSEWYSFNDKAAPIGRS